MEPIVRLYNLTKEQKYLDFAAYIVEEGGAEGINIFELAYENKLYPYQYGVSKAYEMTSCFEGLLEYYQVTEQEKYKIAVLNYAKAILDSEVSVIGSCGITHELFDHTKNRQTVRYDGVMQETCVTVTWMKFCSRLLELTGDSVYADAMEQSFYNAYLGAVNTEHCECMQVLQKFADRGVISTYMPFDSYSPLTTGKRGQQVGGNQLLPDKSYYGCCAAIGAAGVGIFLKKAIVTDENGITVNFFEAGKAQVKYRGVTVLLSLDTNYPVDGHVTVSVQTEMPIDFTLKIRNPGWADSPNGYRHYTQTWHHDTIELYWDMPIQLHAPEHWEEDVIYTDMSKRKATFHTADPIKVYHTEQDDHYIAVTKGPLTLAADERTGKSCNSVFSLGYQYETCENQIADRIPCLLKLRFKPKEGEPFYLVDYASAGHDWKTNIAAWLPTEP